jgi:hypothetical protein
MRNLTGLPGFSGRISSYMPRPLDLRRTFPSKPYRDGLVLSSVNVKTLDVRVIFSRSCRQHFRVHGKPLWPARFPVYASPVLFARVHLFELRHRRNTRYGWVAGPYPTGTFTPQDVPDLSRRDNVKISRSVSDRLDCRVGLFFTLPFVPCQGLTPLPHRSLSLLRLTE